ncbi:MAG TPA: serine/threonine-protein kinase PknK, partial [Polyangiaceae bacterium]|nr:serine/threonine-protein kinase PknK [Polyangiaceae bacterium]
QGLVHRDLKPDNILLDRGRPVLVDFGLALRQREEGQRREVLDVAAGGMGTPPYMSPEQIRGRALDARADLYALGCILYECLTGAPPFMGSPVSVLNAHLRDDPIPPSALVEGVPEELETLVLRLLAKEPRDRIGYASEVAEALAELTEVASTPAPSIPVPSSRPYLYRPELAGRAGLVASLRKVITGSQARGALVLIGGQSGMGKTRLATDLAQQATMHGARVVLGRCQQVRAEGALAISAPLHPFRPMLQLVADRCRRGGAEETRTLLGDRRAVLAPYEPALASLPAPMPVLDELSAGAARERVFEALEHVLAELSRRDRLVLVLDDLQWADELSAGFLSRLDRRYFETSELVLVGTYRSDELTAELEPIVAAEGAHVVELQPLGRAAVSSMVCDMLAMAEPPSALIDFLMRESEGNPFFIAEYLDLAVNEGILERRRAASWTVRGELDVDALPVPGGLRDVVDRRLAALSGPARELTLVAAVLGRDFDGRVLLGASASLGESARAALEELRRRRILEEGTRGDLRFAHDKLREAAYAHIATDELPAFHRRAGDALEREVRGRDDEALYHAALANHFTIARDGHRALTYLERAGEQALRDGASMAARGFFERAKNLAEEEDVATTAERRARWERRLGEASYNLGDLPSARRHLETALEGFGVRRRVPVLRGALADAASMVVVVSRQLARIAGGRRPSMDIEDGERVREATRAMERLSQVDYFLNRQTAAFLDGLECLRLAERLGPTPELARAYATLEVALGFVPARGLASRCGRRAQAIAEDVADAPASAYVGLLRGLHAINEGRHRDARGHLRRACELAQRSKDVRTEQEARANLGQAHAMGGDQHAAERCYRELLRSAERSHNRQAMSWANSGLAAIRLNR